MVWCNKGFHATFVAKVSVALSWALSAFYVAFSGWRHNHEPNAIFRPTPVRIAFPPFANINSFLPSTGAGLEKPMWYTDFLHRMFGCG